MATVPAAVGARSAVVNLCTGSTSGRRSGLPASPVTPAGVVRDGVACVPGAHGVGEDHPDRGVGALGLVVPHRRSGRLRLGHREIEAISQAPVRRPGVPAPLPRAGPPPPPAATTDGVEQWQVPAVDVPARCGRRAVPGRVRLVPVHCGRRPRWTAFWCRSPGAFKGLVELARNTFQFNEQSQRFPLGALKALG